MEKNKLYRMRTNDVYQYGKTDISKRQLDDTNDRNSLKSKEKNTVSIILLQLSKKL